MSKFKVILMVKASSLKGVIIFISKYTSWAQCAPIIIPATHIFVHVVEKIFRNLF